MWVIAWRDEIENPGSGALPWFRLPDWTADLVLADKYKTADAALTVALRYYDESFTVIMLLEDARLIQALRDL